jgi:peptidoglycan/xylan/chitin deacetylase (PgdA/CDA1 family)
MASRYDYWPITERPRLEWPEGKRLAFYLGLNIEHFHHGKPSTSLFPGTVGLPVDPLNHGWRDYGTRVGIWRMIEALDKLNLPASVLLNSDVCTEYPEIIAAGVQRDWAWLGHGKTNSEFWTGMSEDEEGPALQAIVDTITTATGKAPRGWLGPALTETPQTPDLLAEHGFTYTMDWIIDDQPFPMNVRGAERFISVPYSAEINDIPAFLVAGATAEGFAQMITDQFDLLYQEAATRPGGVLAVSLHPFLVNVPFRHKYIVQALEYIVGHDDVWCTTSDAIADHYLENYYDGAVASLAARNGGVTAAAGKE